MKSLAISEQNLEQLQVNLREGRADAASLNLVLVVEPQYPETREDETLFGSAFSDYFAEGAELSVAFSVGVEVPLYNGGKAAYQAEANEAAHRTRDTERG